MMLSGNSVFWIFELTCPSRFSDPLGFASRRAIAFASSLSQVFGGGGGHALQASANWWYPGSCGCHRRSGR